ncbi:MAG: Ig-like domain-containing protein [Oscillospiraceae bacterium]|nr:Ig-like domain-containing protein [Oscillospiraceae bacterium]
MKHSYKQTLALALIPFLVAAALTACGSKTDDSATLGTGEDASLSDGYSQGDEPFTFATSTTMYSLSEEKTTTRSTTTTKKTTTTAKKTTTKPGGTIPDNVTTTKPAATTTTAATTTAAGTTGYKALEALYWPITELNLTVGQSYPIKPTKVPADATEGLLYYSQGPSFANYDAAKGAIVASKYEGVADIYVEAQDHEGMLSRIRVTVSKITATSVEITSTTGISFKAGGSLQLVAKVLPENVSETGVIWGSENEEIAVVDANGKVTSPARAAGEPYVTGNVVIQAVSKDGKARARVTIQVTP